MVYSADLFRVQRPPVIEACVRMMPSLAFERSINSTMLRTIAMRLNGDCTWCGTCVPPKRQTWCSQQCVDEGLLYLDAGKMAWFVRDRDNCRCAFCGQYAFEVDHIWPVIRGGGLCGPSNLRTLCTECHLGQSKILQRELRNERIAAGLLVF